MENAAPSQSPKRASIYLVGFPSRTAHKIAASLDKSYGLSAASFSSVDEALSGMVRPRLICLYDGLGVESDLMRLNSPTLVIGTEDARSRAAEVVQIGAVAYYNELDLRPENVAGILAAYHNSFDPAHSQNAQARIFDSEGPTLGLVEWSRELVIERWSKEAEFLLGFPRERTEGLTLGDWLMPEKELERFLAGARGLRDGLLGNFKINCLAKRIDGTLLPTNWRVTPLRDEGETFVSIFEITQPLEIIAQGHENQYISASDRAEESIVLSETSGLPSFTEQAAFLAHAVEHLAIGVYFKELREDFAITVWNAEMERLFQVPKAEIIGKSIEEVFDDPGLFATLCEVKSQRSRSRAIMPRNPRPDSPNASFIADITKTPILDEAGKVKALIGIVHDVTDRIRSENRLVAAFNELEASKEKLELSNLEIRRGIEKAKKLAVAAQASNKAKTFFMSNISHELRTPLTSIISLSHALLEKTFGDLNTRQNEFLSIISESAQHLQGLITDILDLSKIELGKLSLKVSESSISDLASTTLRIVAQMAQSKRIECALTISTKSDSIEVDSKRLRQILLNLISNAIKFTKPDSTIHLDISDHPSVDACVFRVRDKGIGIRDSDIEKIFLPFTQLDDSLSKQYEGTGLGLAIVAKLVELHGGSLSVLSEKNEGATFSFVLPRLQPSSDSLSNVPTLSEVAQGAPPQALAIIVDENERVAWQLRNAALEAGAQEAVIALPNELSAYYDQVQPALLVADLSTLINQGSEWMRQAKAHPKWAKASWIAVASLDIDNSRALAKSLDFETLLPKPISPDSLRTAFDARFPT